MRRKARFIEKVLMHCIRTFLVDLNLMYDFD